MSHFCEIVVQKDLENLVYFRKALKKNCPELFYATCTTTVESDMDTHYYVKLSSSSVYGNSDSAAIVQWLLWRFL